MLQDLPSSCSFLFDVIMKTIRCFPKEGYCLCKTCSNLWVGMKTEWVRRKSSRRISVRRGEVIRKQQACWHVQNTFTAHHDLSTADDTILAASASKLNTQSKKACRKPALQLSSSRGEMRGRIQMILSHPQTRRKHIARRGCGGRQGRRAGNSYREELQTSILKGEVEDSWSDVARRRRCLMATPSDFFPFISLSYFPWVWRGNFGPCRCPIINMSGSWNRKTGIYRVILLSREVILFSTNRTADADVHKRTTSVGVTQWGHWFTPAPGSFFFCFPLSIKIPLPHPTPLLQANPSLITSVYLQSFLCRKIKGIGYFVQVKRINFSCSCNRTWKQSFK